MKFSGAALAVSVSKIRTNSDTTSLRSGWYTGSGLRSAEDGDTGLTPVLVLERPVKQKIRVEKKTRMTRKHRKFPV